MKKIGLGFISLGVASLMLSGCSSNGLPTDQIPQGLGGDTNNSASPSPTSSASAEPTPTGMPVVDENSTVPQPKEEVSVQGPLPLPTTGFDYSNPDKTVITNLPAGPIDQNGKMTGNPADYQGANNGGNNAPATAPELVDKVGQGSDTDKRNAAESYIKYLNFKNEGNFSEACQYARLAVGTTSTCEEKLSAADPRFNNHPEGIRVDRVSNVNIDGDKAELFPAVFVYGNNQHLAKVEMFRTANPEVWQIVL